jgi:hypothetical protein
MVHIWAARPVGSTEPLPLKILESSSSTRFCGYYTIPAHYLLTKSHRAYSLVTPSPYGSRVTERCTDVNLQIVCRATVPIESYNHSDEQQCERGSVGTECSSKIVCSEAHPKVGHYNICSTTRLILSSTVWRPACVNFQTRGDIGGYLSPNKY